MIRRGITRPASGRFVSVLLLALAVVLGCAGVRGDPSTSHPAVAMSSAPSPAAAGSLVRSGTISKIFLPPVHGRFSYQIGGAYDVPSAVMIVDRDHADRAVPRKYSICYLNAFQAQPEAIGWWTTYRPNLLLRRSSGSLIIDTNWGEPLLDISTAQKRASLITIVGTWIDGCAAAGYRGIEADNLDSYTRSEGRLSMADALAFGGLLVTRAHRDQMAIAQKNGAELAVAAHRSGFDFAVAEECQVFTECDSYTNAYGSHVIEIEYTDNPISAFTDACRLRGRTISVVLRDRAVTRPGEPQHVERWCP